MRKKLKEPEKTEDGLLTKLYRDILFRSGRIDKIQEDIATYKEKGGTRAVGSILKDIMDGSLTWKSFIFLLFRIQRIHKLELKAKVYYSDEEDDYTEHLLVATPKTSTIDKKKSKNRIIKDDKSDK